MFDVPTLFALFIPIAIFYLSFHFNLKKEIDELSYSLQSQNKYRIKIAKKILKWVRISTIILILIILTFQIIPYCKNIPLNSKFDLSIINTWNFIPKFNILNPILKFFHIKADMFSDSNFVLSFIVGIIFSFIIELIWAFLLYIFNEHKKVTNRIKLIVFAYGLLWVNNSFSSFLANHIAHYFALLSFIINIFVYALIGFIVAVIIIIMGGTELNENDKNNSTPNQRN